MTDERTTPEVYLGTWRIREIGEHTSEGIDLVGPAEVVFDKDALRDRSDVGSMLFF